MQALCSSSSLSVVGSWPEDGSPPAFRGSVLEFRAPQPSSLLPATPGTLGLPHDTFVSLSSYDGLIQSVFVSF